MTAVYSPLVERALRRAARAHRHQTRKSSDLPYFQHAASVVLILARCGFDQDDMLAAAALHDTLEDTDCTVESLTAEFPESVVGLVQECSEQKKDASGNHRPWRDRKESHIDLVRGASVSARAIILADKLHNLASMAFDLEQGEELWSRFNAGQSDVIWYHRAIVDAATEFSEEDAVPTADLAKLNELVTACRDLIDRLATT